MPFNNIEDFKRLSAGSKPSMLSHDNSGMTDSIRGILAKISPQIPPGINMATGLMSMAFPGKQGNIVENLPQIMRGTDPTMSESISQEIGKFLPGFETGGEVGALAAKQGVKKAAQGLDYVNPAKATEKFRSSFGEGTSKENIAKIGEQVKSSYQTELEKALEPKDKLFSKHAESQIVSHPNESEYLKDMDASKFYNKGSTLSELHANYKKNPSLETYDKLQSALKAEQRRFKENPHLATDEKLNQLKLNIKNLDKDVTNWSKSLPKEEASLEKNWRTLYRENVTPYEDTKTPIALRKLAEGKWEEVTPAQIGNIFTKMNPNTKKIFADLPPETSKHIIYNAIQKVQPGDAGEMANTILELKRTKGYDQFITKDMEKWATDMQKQVSRADLIKDALKLGTGAATGGLLGGATGAVVGAALPFAKEGAIKIAKKFKK